MGRTCLNQGSGIGSYVLGNACLPNLGCLCYQGTGHIRVADDAVGPGEQAVTCHSHCPVATLARVRPQLCCMIFLEPMRALSTCILLPHPFGV